MENDDVIVKVRKGLKVKVDILTAENIKGTYDESEKIYPYNKILEISILPKLKKQKDLHQEFKEIVDKEFWNLI